MHRTRPHLLEQRCRKALGAWLGLLVLCASAELAAQDGVSCAKKDEQLVCEVELDDFLLDIRHVLNNGWENVLEFNLMIYQENDDFVGHNYAELSARCYIDPFDDPCLALWSGSDSWQSYTDVDDMLDALTTFQLVSQGADKLSGSYYARLSVALNPITDKQADVIRTWLARHRGGHLVMGRSDSSIFGTFVSVFANIRSGKAEASASILSQPFVIDD